MNLLRLKSNAKERELNNLTFLSGYLVHIFHFKNTPYIKINRTFKAKRENKTALSRI
jgi:hypothetical protein